MTLDQFVKACEESGVEQVVMRRTSEMRPITDDDGTTVGPVQRVVLLGYGRGELIRHERPGTGVDCMAAPRRCHGRLRCLIAQLWPGGAEARRPRGRQPQLLKDW